MGSGPKSNSNPKPPLSPPPTPSPVTRVRPPPPPPESSQIPAPVSPSVFQQSPTPPTQQQGQQQDYYYRPHYHHHQHRRTLSGYSRLSTASGSALSSQPAPAASSILSETLSNIDLDDIMQLESDVSSDSALMPMVPWNVRGERSKSISISHRGRAPVGRGGGGGGSITLGQRRRATYQFGELRPRQLSMEWRNTANYHKESRLHALPPRRASYGLEGKNISKSQGKDIHKSGIRSVRRPTDIPMSEHLSKYP
ncbi:hypothetical protein AMATHDRAFT_48218 [Amanita thiersii Skay4041]|uniref:Uncharacterized protein n=1 Tax=Amanita thiersii Skay4041 TaxID=703135 RepID=A0A2A9NJ33_9AGAR|nr:hypothetical protein AMATHDRAFT_48218 [Amanita thiersii Skay4041]